MTCLFSYSLEPEYQEKANWSYRHTRVEGMEIHSFLSFVVHLLHWRHYDSYFQSISSAEDIGLQFLRLCIPFLSRRAERGCVESR